MGSPGDLSNPFLDWRVTPINLGASVRPLSIRSCWGAGKLNGWSPIMGPSFPLFFLIIFLILFGRSSLGDLGEVGEWIK